MKKMILAVPALVLSLLACTPTPVVLDTCTTEISSANSNNIISSNTTWVNSASSCDYLIKNSVEVSAAATLTIAAGTTIQFETGTRMQLLGILIANGSSNARITLRGATQNAGFWNGIRLFNAGSNQMAFVNISDTAVAAIFVRNTKLALSDSRISNNSGYGLEIDSQSADLTGFARNVFSGTVLSGVKLSLKNIKYLDSATDYHGTGAGNTPNGKSSIEISNGLLESPETATLKAQKYLIADSLNIDAALTIEPGAVLEFASGNGIYINSPQGSLSAIGSSSQRIGFRGVTPNAGTWIGMVIGSQSMINRLEFVDIMHTGSASGVVGALYLNGGKMIIKDSSFSNNSYYGINRGFDPSALTDLGGNTFANNSLGNFAP